MHEFETFIYLDVQKTASGFISTFLNRCCTEKKVRRKQHLGLPSDYDRKKFCFISVRDPLDQYISLYSFGCQSRGDLFHRLEENGYASLYDGTWRGFQSWLDFVLSPPNAHLFDATYGTAGHGRISRLVGYQSYRVLVLALPDMAGTLAACRTKANVRRVYGEMNVVDFTIRQESLRSDLANLVRTRLSGSFRDVAKAMRFIEDGQALNPSDRIDRVEANPTLDAKQRRRLRQREWLLYDEFGYGSQDGKDQTAPHPRQR